MPSDIAENSQKNIHDAATFSKWILFRDNSRGHLTNCKTVIKNGYLLLQGHLCLSIIGATESVFQFPICFVKIFKKPSAKFRIFSGQHKPKKQRVHYRWIIRQISLCWGFRKTDFVDRYQEIRFFVHSISRLHKLSSYYFNFNPVVPGFH